MYKNSYIGDGRELVYFFGTKEYIEQKDPYDFYLIQTKKSYLYIFLTKEKQLITPLKATFAQCYFHDRKEAIKILEKCIEVAKTTGTSLVKFIAPPNFIFQRNFTDLRNSFDTIGFTVAEVNRNFHIPISETNYLFMIHASEQRRLKKCIKNGFQFSEWKNPDLEFTHEFIKNCRERKGYPMTINQDEFVKMFCSFSDKYQVFTVKDNEKIIALAVTVRVTENILYLFYPADLFEYLNYSPSVMLHAGLYHYCQNNNIEALDLGIASDKGVDNEGLIRFKTNLGGIESAKNTYEYNFI